MQYVVIETWTNLSCPYVTTDEDGNTLVFDNLKEAQEEADTCQEGIVVPLDNIIDLLKRVSQFLEVLRYEEGKQSDPHNLENEVNSYLK